MIGQYLSNKTKVVLFIGFEIFFNLNKGLVKESESSDDSVGVEPDE
jgi:hypothetical protein